MLYKEFIKTGRDDSPAWQDARRETLGFPIESVPASTAGTIPQSGIGSETLDRDIGGVYEA